MNRDDQLTELLREYSRIRSISEATKRSYEMALRIFQRDTRIRRFNEITRDRLIDWRDAVLGRASASSWNTYLRHMRALFNFAKKNGYIDDNPFLDVEMIRTPKRRKRVVKDDAIEFYRKILENQEDGWFWWIVTLTFYYTGMRRRQLVGLRWSDLDFTRQTILLRSENSKNQREWEIPIAGGLLEHLEQLRKKTRAVAGAHYLQHGQAFNITLFNHSYSGCELSVEQLSDFYNRLRRRHGKGQDHAISAHRFRHRFATELVRQAPPKYVQELMGHSSIHTTLEYVEVDMDDLRTTIAKLPNIGG